MKYPFLIGLICLVSLVSNAHAAAPSNVVGRILLQVEEHGEAWYVPPEPEERFYVKNGDAAYAALRTFGLGITSADLEKIPIGLEDRFEDTDQDGDGLPDQLEEAIGANAEDEDSDDDGYSDGDEVRDGYNPSGAGTVSVDSGLVDRLKGYILLQVEAHGEAWYVHPDDGKRYYMKDGDAAYQIMRYLSLGITNADLEQIPLLSTTLDCGDSLDCLLGAVESDVAAKVTTVIALNLFGVDLSTTMNYEHSLPESDGELYTFDSVALEQLADGVEQPEIAGHGQVCTYENKEDMAEVIRNWITVIDGGAGALSTEDMDFATCTATSP